MKKELYEKWTAALRSDQYEQGRYALNCNGKFCCLGVLCETMGLEKELDDTLTSRKMYNYFYKDRQYNAILGYGELPIDLGLWFNVEENYSVLDYLMAANDAYKKSFAQIADMLDELVEKGKLVLT